MYVSTIPMICYYNGQILRTKTYVKYGGGGGGEKMLLCLWMYRLNACLNNLLI